MSNEKEIRESWITKHEDELHRNNSLSSEILTLRSAKQQLEVDISNVKINLVNMETLNGTLQTEFNNLLLEHSKLKAKYENMERALHSKTELLREVDEQQRFLVRKLKEDN